MTKNAVRGSTTGRPIMILLDLLGRKWTLRIFWELRNGPLTFRALQAQCDDVSPTSLNNRLKDLRDAGLIKNGESGYQLTDWGDDLGRRMTDLNDWSERWQAQQTGRSAPDLTMLS